MSDETKDLTIDPEQPGQPGTSGEHETSGDTAEPEAHSSYQPADTTADEAKHKLTGLGLPWVRG